MQKAKELCEDLLKNVREQYEEFKNRPPPQRGYGTQSTGYGGERGYGDRAPDRSTSYGGGGYGGYNSQSSNTPGNVLSPIAPSAPGAASPGAGADYAAQYAQYYAANGQADPYAAYGMPEHTSLVHVLTSLRWLRCVCPVLPAIYGSRRRRSTATSRCSWFWSSSSTQ